MGLENTWAVLQEWDNPAFPLCKENDGPESLLGCPPKHGCQTIKEEVMLSYLGTWVLPG